MVTLQKTSIREKDMSTTQYRTEDFFDFFFPFVAHKSQSRALQGYIFNIELHTPSQELSLSCVWVWQTDLWTCFPLQKWAVIQR